jgi:uncharacterized protein YjbI with pentapeptide repeats
MATERPGTAAPRLAPLEFGELASLEASVFLDADGDDVEQAVCRDLRVDELRWDTRRRIDASLVSGLSGRSWRARGLTLTDTRLERIDLLSIAAPEAGWRDVEVRASRIGSLELYDANLRRVSFVGCKLGFMNLRGADLADVAFTDCVLEDLDLMRTTASRVALTGCRIERLEVSHASLSDVDLRGAELADISGLEGLRGVTVSIDQLLDLAPVLAGRLGIRVEEGAP